MLDEKAWKSAEEDSRKRFATANIEAHVLSVLEDKYFGWPYDAKQSFRDHQDDKLLTEYHLPEDKPHVNMWQCMSMIWLSP
jgi:hypothetical protein